MTEIIKESTDRIIILNDSATFYFSGSAEIKNYFRSHKLSNNYLIANTLSVLDTFTKKADYDLIFTT